MFRSLFIIVIAAAASGCASFGATSGRVVIQDENLRVDVAFSDHDRRLIAEHYRRAEPANRKGLPPGLAKRGGDLPPGLAKKDRLPPGLAKRDRLPEGIEGEALPRELESRLSRLPAGYMRLRIGQDFVILNRQTRVVLDIARELGN